MFVITGGGTGIGRALALNLASKGCSVLIAGRRQAMLDEVVAENPLKISAISVDLSNPSGRDDLLAHIGNKSLTALVHNAGILEPLRPLREISLPEWQFAQQVNVEAPLFLSQALLVNLKGGRVLHLSSAMAHMAAAGWGCYCVTKSALYMLYQMFNKEQSDIAFGSVMPGITDTNMQSLIREAEGLPDKDSAFFNRLYDESMLLSPETVAAFLSYLLLETSPDVFREKEWDIYDSKHHPHWLGEGIVPNVFGDA